MLPGDPETDCRSIKNRKTEVKKMKKTCKLLALVMAALMMLALAACGAKEAADEGQNPVMNFIGNYSCDRETIASETT